ncbi:hypothetical protein ORI89_09435 [Sphingobacterium sp. UT-1RO-CII-1]|uniref:hypothetical protein n=1 Tax=Sphingobacterium sp. UT-1RO-CII-1 TaxID=2995225 RepID=UPI00227A95EE|nr:hypothetical protein [Sphingobacterium sp. UT-1RO-CII-1]MCY4779873.1 hypothetical protein [Sphingobacterium sp. UT-1RO-CII-1]
MVISKLIYLYLSLFLLMGTSYGQTLPNLPYSPGTNLDQVTPVGTLVLGNGYEMVNAPFDDVRYWHILSMRYENP